MARSLLTNITTDVNSDPGGVLWSFIIGEQLEYAVSINFINNLTGYEIEAVLLEGNMSTGSPPTNVSLTAKKLRLVHRLHDVYAANTTYRKGALVQYNEKVYEKIAAGSTSAFSTNDWTLLTTRSVAEVFIQFPKTIGSMWAVKPTIDSNTYGFFELRISEPAGISFPRTWKPIRGLVELLYSPTELVPDSQAEGTEV
jgi:hypothetical protein